jgi:N6-L-threonylcarbamoyladenine synthase
VSVVVAFDTATEACCVGVGELTDSGAADVLVTRDVVAPRQALTTVLPMLGEALEEAGVDLGQVRLVAVGAGPGSYTGVRIGIAAAKGLAHGLGVPLRGVGTLDAVAVGMGDAPGIVGVVGDAMRGEVYPALFEVKEGGVRRLTEDRVADPGAVAREWAARGDVGRVTGSGLAKHAEAFGDALGPQTVLVGRERWYPTGAHLLDVVARQGPDGLHPGAVLPVYTRLSDAEELERASAGDVPPSGVAGPEHPSGVGEERS